MEATALVAESVFSGGKLTKVARGLGTDIVIELEDNPTGGLGVDCHVELRTE